MKFTCRNCGVEIRLIRDNRLCDACNFEQELKEIIGHFWKHKDCQNVFYYTKYGDETLPFENGWVCANHDVKIGYNPLFDRYLTFFKVSAILHDLFDAGMIYVSNGSEGDGIAGWVAEECERADNYTVPFIISKIFQGRGEYEKKKGRTFVELAKTIEPRIAEEVV